MTERSILFADVAGSTRLYEKLGDAEAKRAIEHCLKRVALAVEAFQGRVVKTIGDAVLAVFPDAELCLQAACQMQQRVSDLPHVAGMPLAIRVGFHHGPVIEDGSDVFGDAVNVAARMGEIARPEQIIASAGSVAGLPLLVRQATREIDAVAVKGKSAPVPICEVLWRGEGDLTLMAAPSAAPSAAGPGLSLRLDGADQPLPAQWDLLLLGRDKSCDLCLPDPMASRQHARIERRGDKFVLADQSTNGTWLAFAGESEVALRREEAILRGSGRISLGHPYRAGAASLEFKVG